MTPRQCGIAAGVRGHGRGLPWPDACALVLCLAVLGMIGCGGKHRVPVLPLTFNPTIARASEPLEPPDLHPDLPQGNFAMLVIPRPLPRRPVIRASEVAAAPVVEPTPKPAPPRISLRMSPAEESSYRQLTNQAIAVAERNLQSVNSSTLSVAQQDLVEKIRGFLSQSREAIRATDWLRAHSLATKAQVLSEELISLK